MEVNQWQVLVVEDEDDSLQVISQIFEHYQAEIRVARNGRACLDVLATFRPTVIIMDLAMPGMDGWQALAQIRADPRLQRIPVVAITAFDSPNVAEEALQAGFDAYFAKPVNVAEFIDSLRQVVSKS